MIFLLYILLSLVIAYNAVYNNKRLITISYQDLKDDEDVKITNANAFFTFLIFFLSWPVILLGLMAAQ